MNPQATTAALAAEREATMERLGGEVFDVLVIGGGINGAACARDAALRGMHVAVVERADFASGTSSRSSKLIHGGVRYLQQGDIGLVLESCRERDLLRTRIAPHLVRAQPFVFPIYDDDAVPLWQLRIGLTLYDLLAGLRNVSRHRALSRDEILEVEPALDPSGLLGGALYYDCWTDDARLTIETMMAARDEGAVVLNHAEVVAFERSADGPLDSARVVDRTTGGEATVRARAFVNVTGPWLDRVSKLADPEDAPRLRATKGVHAVFGRDRIGNRNAVVMRGTDDRVMFAIPWQQQTLVGTTDTYYDGDPGAVRADEDDVAYILAAVDRCFPGAAVGRSDVISTYAGLRPLVAPDDARHESDVSRDDRIFESDSGLISLGGGKLTTHRHVAERIVDRVVKRLDRSFGRCRTKDVPLPGGVGVAPSEVDEDFPVGAAEHLTRRYGARAGRVLSATEADANARQRLVEDLPDLLGEVRHAVENEMALTLEDALVRRVQVALRSREGAGQVVDVVARLMGEELGWSEERIAEEVARYRADLANPR